MALPSPWHQNERILKEEIVCCIEFAAIKVHKETKKRNSCASRCNSTVTLSNQRFWQSNERKHRAQPEEIKTTTLFSPAKLSKLCCFIFRAFHDYVKEH